MTLRTARCWKEDTHNTTVDLQSIYRLLTRRWAVSCVTTFAGPGAAVNVELYALHE